MKRHYEEWLKVDGTRLRALCFEHAKRLSDKGAVVMAHYCEQPHPECFYCETLAK